MFITSKYNVGDVVWVKICGRDHKYHPEKYRIQHIEFVVDGDDYYDILYSYIRNINIRNVGYRECDVYTSKELCWTECHKLNQESVELNAPIT